MKTIFYHLHRFFLACSILFLFLGILFLNSQLSINIHDWYLVIGYLTIGVAFCILFAIIGGTYYFLLKAKRPLLLWGSKVQMVCTSLGLVLSVFLTIYYILNNGSLIAMNFSGWGGINLLLYVIVLLLFPVQIIFSISSKKMNP